MVVWKEILIFGVMLGMEKCRGKKFFYRDICFKSIENFCFEKRLEESNEFLNFIFNDFFLVC